MYHLGLAVHKPGGENGEVRIAYKTLEQLDDIARRLKWGHALPRLKTSPASAGRRGRREGSEAFRRGPGRAR
jgi:hypothetical protein